MSQNRTEQQIRELETQLTCPTGELGIEVGITMNETNVGMTLNSIDFLDLKDNDAVLELGHGNCGHLDELLIQRVGIKYFGLEVSETMFGEAKRINFDQQAVFKLYDGETIPYTDECFDKLLSVNTVYFWSNPAKLMNEIDRTLKSDGVCVLSFVDKDFMKKLPFVGEKFSLFDEEKIDELAKKTNLKIVQAKELTEKVRSKTGEQVERVYKMVKLKKI